MNSDIIIVEDFLHKVTQKKLEAMILGNNSIKWGYRQAPNYVNPAIENKFKHNDGNILNKEFGDFSHQLLNYNTKSEVYDLFPDFKNLIQHKFKIKVKNIIRININFAFPIGIETSNYDTPHYDFFAESKTYRSLVCYVNESDGDTVFFDELKDEFDVNTSKKTIIKRISPKAGRAVLFNSDRYHSGSFPSKKIRIIINIILSVEDE